MKLFSSTRRKDGKYKVTLGFDSGKRLTKIVDQETLDKWKAESRELELKPNPFG